MSERKARKTVRQWTLDTFKEYGGWWRLDGMAEWLSVSPDALRKVWDELEAEGLLERKGKGTYNARGRAKVEVEE